MNSPKAGKKENVGGGSKRLFTNKRRGGIGLGEALGMGLGGEIRSGSGEIGWGWRVNVFAPF